jgi:hypothetical protein
MSWRRGGEETPHCLHAASRRFVYLRGVDRVLHYMCKSDACTKIQERRGLTRTQGGAFGVVGFSGVKDARKNVLIADASASADWPARSVRSLCKWCAGGVHLVCIHWTNTGQILDVYWTKTGHSLGLT